MKIDPKKPYNSLPKLPAGIDLTDPELLVKTIETSDAISKLSTQISVGRSRMIASAFHLLTPLFVPEAVSSSGIENIVTTNESVYLAKIKEVRELTSTEKEALNYVDAVTFGLDRLFKREFLVTNDFVDMQKILEPMNSGIRTMPGTHLSNPLTKKIVYTPPDGKARIQKLLANFEGYFNDEAPSHEVFARMAILHYQFEAIHPFHDGNGRTGRMLMPLYLMKQSKLPLPVLFISKYILDNRDEYYRRIRAVTFENAWHEWIMYILEATRSQALYTSNILEKISRMTEKVKIKLRDELPRIYSAELVDFIFSNLFFTQQRYETEMKIHAQTARKHLLKLEELGILTKKKQSGKNRYLFVCPQYITLLRNA